MAEGRGAMVGAGVGGGCAGRGRVGGGALDGAVCCVGVGRCRDGGAALELVERGCVGGGGVWVVNNAGRVGRGGVVSVLDGNRTAVSRGQRRRMLGRRMACRAGGNRRRRRYVIHALGFDKGLVVFLKNSRGGRVRFLPSFVELRLIISLDTSAGRQACNRLPRWGGRSGTAVCADACGQERMSGLFLIPLPRPIRCSLSCPYCLQQNPLEWR